MSGWIKLHRKLVDWEWYSDVPCKTLFIHLLLVANHKPSRWKGIDIGVGQKVTGRHALSEETGLSEQEIRTALTKLKSTGEITIKSTNKFSLITVCKYKDYQFFEMLDQPTDQPADQPTINQQSTTNKNEKNKRIEDIVPASKSKRFIPPSVEEVAQYCLERKNSIDPQYWWDSYQAKNWMVGKNKMSDWKAAVRTWEGKNYCPVPEKKEKINGITFA